LPVIGILLWIIIQRSLPPTLSHQPSGRLGHRNHLWISSLFSQGDYLSTLDDQCMHTRGVNNLIHVLRRRQYKT